MGKDECSTNAGTLAGANGHCFRWKISQGQLADENDFPLFKSKLWDDQPYKQNLPTSPSFITYGSEKDFEKEKQGLLIMVNRFTEANILSDRHPVFGKLTKENWSKATWKHIDHHLQQFGV
jgi:hypothetical protein